MLSFLYVYSDHSILECYNLFSGVELSMRSFFVIVISMRAGPAFLQFDWSKASLSMDLPVFVYSHMKTGFKFFQDREDIGSFFMCLELCLENFDFKPSRENLTGLLICPD